MVCFCDIPLTATKNHTDYYGKFAIGMNSKWGHDNLNPVFYVQEDSLPANMLINIQHVLLEENSNILLQIKDDTDLNPEIKKILEAKQISNFIIFHDFIAFIKKYKGVSRKKQMQEKIFYKEREW